MSSRRHLGKTERRTVPRQSEVLGGVGVRDISPKTYGRRLGRSPYQRLLVSPLQSPQGFEDNPPCRSMLLLFMSQLYICSGLGV